MDDNAPRLARCFRGHATPAGKTFCETCGASLDAPSPSNVILPKPRRTLLRRRG